MYRAQRRRALTSADMRDPGVPTHVLTTFGIDTPWAGADVTLYNISGTQHFLIFADVRAHTYIRVLL
eukprot:gene21821-15517_t